MKPLTRWLGASALSLAAVAAHAQAYPAKPVTLIIPFAAVAAMRRSTALPRAAATG